MFTDMKVKNTVLALTSNQDENFGFFFFLGPLDIGFAIIFISLINHSERGSLFRPPNATIILYNSRDDEPVPVRWA